jgi:hypothetical protein
MDSVEVMQGIPRTPADPIIMKRSKLCKALLANSALGTHVGRNACSIW